MASKLLTLRRLSRFLKPSPASPSLHSSCSLIYRSQFLPLKASEILGLLEDVYPPSRSTYTRSFCSRSLNHNDESQGPAAIDYQYVFSFRSLAHTFLCKASYPCVNNSLFDPQNHRKGGGGGVKGRVVV